VLSVCYVFQPATFGTSLLCQIGSLAALFLASGYHSKLKE
jgi:hypothetical protein